MAYGPFLVCAFCRQTDFHRELSSTLREISTPVRQLGEDTNFYGLLVQTTDSLLSRINASYLNSSDSTMSGRGGGGETLVGKGNWCESCGSFVFLE